jgi:hypothetical protein
MDGKKGVKQHGRFQADFLLGSRRRRLITQSPFRHTAEVEMHLPGGFTRLILSDLAHGGHRLDIPTDAIPLLLRPIGSRLVVVAPRFQVEPSDTQKSIREMCRLIQIEMADS